MPFVMETGSWIPVTQSLLCAVVILAFIWFWNVRQVFKTIERMGLRGPPPKFLIGNMKDITGKGFHITFKEWEQQYGKVYGVYRGKTPSVVFHDLDMLHEVMVKQFAFFPDRLHNQIAMASEPLKSMLQFLLGDHWRHVRKSLSPAFSTGKLKKMLPVIKQCCTNLVQHVQQKTESGVTVDATQLSMAFSMDVTAGTGFAMKVNCLQNPDEEFGMAAKRLATGPRWVYTLLMTFPYLTPVLAKLGISIFASREDRRYMFDVIQSALQDRRKDNSGHSDFLQLMVDLGQRHDTWQRDHIKDTSGSDWNRKGLTADEIYANTLNFILAGHGNIASSLAFLLYNLAGNPHCLHKLQEEMDAVLGQDEVDYRVVKDMPYLDACLNESLRLYPPALMLDRTCMHDTEVKGLRIPKGTLVTIPVYSIHTNPEQWPEPLKFDPERYTAEARASRHPVSHMPFGLGPRNCIAMRMSQMEVKMAVTCIVQKFSPVLCEQSVFPAQIAPDIRLGSVDKMWIKFQPR